MHIPSLRSRRAAAPPRTARRVHARIRASYQHVRATARLAAAAGARPPAAVVRCPAPTHAQGLHPSQLHGNIRLHSQSATAQMSAMCTGNWLAYIWGNQLQLHVP
jgi:hypothetical protein